MENNKLTDQEFWVDYWNNITIPNVVSEDNAFERCLMRESRKQIKLDVSGQSILDIGCAPGKWCTFFEKEFDMRLSDIDHSIKGIEATRRNFSHLGLQFGELKAADFFKCKPDQSYDFVMSLCFIEHFDNPESVIEKHLKPLKPGGTLILGVPNLTGL